MRRTSNDPETFVTGPTPREVQTFPHRGSWRHAPWCHWERGDGECICGLDDARAALTRREPLDVGMLQRADSDVGLIHDFLYGRGGTMDEAHAACWRIHEVLRPLIGRLEAER